MKNVQPLTIQGPVCELSLLHYLGDGDEVVLVAHPDPRQGGTMLNKVVVSIAKAYQSMGYHVVTFNYRSVDHKQWQEPEGDVDDARAVFKWLRGRFNKVTDLVGFSFGSWVVNQLQDQCIGRCLMVAPPIERYDYAAPLVPTFMLQGCDDEVVSPEATLMFAKKHANELRVIPECGHFFHHKLTLVKQWVYDVVKGKA